LQGLPEAHQVALRDAILERDLSAEESLRIARALKGAELAEDVAVATAFIETICATADPRPERSDPLSQAAGLFAAIESAASGDRGAAEALAASAKSAKAPAFNGDRLRAEVLALARTLARTPAEELVPGGSAYMPLTMLRGTLDALLPPD
jgi:hypothetical protein